MARVNRKKKTAPAPRTASSEIESSLVDLRSRDGMVRRKARNSLARIGRRAVRRLIPLLDDPKVDVRWEAAKTLAQIADAASAGPLVAALEDESFDVRWLAAEGLIAIGPDSLPPLLEALLERYDASLLREGAHHVLHELAKSHGKETLGPVLAALEGVDPGFELQRPVRKALRRLKA
jgi:HEAT repeat protein